MVIKEIAKIIVKYFKIYFGKIVVLKYNLQKINANNCKHNIGITLLDAKLLYFFAILINPHTPFGKLHQNNRTKK